MIGGGTYAQPGEVSLAHGGILFLDELAEFTRSTLDALRQPLENKRVTISRVNGNHTYPAGFMFVAAMNPCRADINMISIPEDRIAIIGARRCSAEDKKKSVSHLSDR